jgi:hypothetical protein
MNWKPGLRNLVTLYLITASEVAKGIGSYRLIRTVTGPLLSQNISDKELLQVTIINIFFGTFFSVMGRSK